MAVKSMESFKGRGGKERKRAKVQKVMDYRNASNESRQNHEKFWKRDEEDLEGYVDPRDRRKNPYRSKLRLPMFEWMRNAWVDNEAPIILDEDHPIEITGRVGVSRESLFTRQAMLDYQLSQTGFSEKFEDLLRSEVGGGTAFWQVVRHTGTARKNVVKPVVGPDGVELIGTQLVEEDVPYPYYGVGIEEVSKWDLWADPAATDLRECPWIIKRALLTKHQIKRAWPATEKIPDKSKGNNDALAWENFPSAETDRDYRQEYDTFSQLNYANLHSQAAKSTTRFAVHVLWDTDEDEIIVTLGDRFLLDYQPLEHGDKKLPFVMSKYLPWNKYFYGKSLPQTIHAVAKACEIIFNMHIDMTQHAAYPQYVVSTMARADVTSLRRGEPGAIIPVVGNPDLLKQLQKNFPAGVATMEEVGFIFQMVQMASNVNNYVTGNNSQGFNRTATGVVTLTQRAQSGFLQHAKRCSSACLEPLGNKMNDAIDVMFDKPKVMSIVGIKGQHYERRWSYEQMTADVIVRPTRLRDHSEKSMEAQMWMQLVQTGITQLPGVDAQEMLRRMFEALGQRDIEKLLPQSLTMALQMRQPVPAAQSLAETMEEHRQLAAQGYVPEVTPDEDDMAHMQLHAQHMQSAQFQSLPESAQTAFWQHVLSHETYAKNEEQVNAMLQAQQGAPAGAAPVAQPGQVGPEALAQAQQAGGQGGSPPAQREATLTPTNVGGQTVNPIRAGAGG